VVDVKFEQREDFRRRLKQEWVLLWSRRFDDKYRAEGVAIEDYPLLFMDRGCIIFASRDAKAPVFSQVLDYWAAQGRIHAPQQAAGGWGKFIKTSIARPSTRQHLARPVGKSVVGQQLKKGGRGWLHAV
jgi:hypothetical protein